MLNLYIGDKDESLYTPAIYFDNHFTNDWMNDPFTSKVVKAIDKSEVIGDCVIKSPTGLIPPQYLSDGTKTLILLNATDSNRFVNINFCGRNCANFILEIAGKKDLYCTIEYPMFFKEPFEIKILNTDTIVTNRSDLADMYIDFL